MADSCALRAAAEVLEARARKQTFWIRVVCKTLTNCAASIASRA